MRRIALVIVNYRTPDLALGAIASLIGERNSEPGLQIILVDGGSGDDSAERLRAGIDHPHYRDWVTLLPLEINGGFGWANNQAILRLLQQEQSPDYIHLLNPDAEVMPGAVSRLADVLDAHPECAAVGSQLLEPDGTPAGSAFEFVTPRRELVRGANLDLLYQLLRLPRYTIERPAGEVDWVTGASVMLRAEALRQAGLFDSGFFLYFEEMELMARMRRRGWSIRHQPTSRVRHIGGAATGVNGSRPDVRRPVRPAYWYRSRRRYLTLVGGRGAALAASLSWLAGHASLLARQWIGSGRTHPIVDRDSRNLIAHGFAPQQAIPAFPLWDEAPGKPPAWMKRQV